jgi:pre-mRNA-processing factor SLU7
VLVSNHTAVWGSFWAAGAWGYACCRSTVKSSYCTGAAGIAAAEASDSLMAANVAAKAQTAAAAATVAAAAAAAAPPPSLRGVTWGSDVPSDVQLDREQLARALRAEEERAAEAARVGGDERKRGYNSMGAEAGVSEEEMEAWRLKRTRSEDPMTAAEAGAAAGGGYDYV